MKYDMTWCIPVSRSPGSVAWLEFLCELLSWCTFTEDLDENVVVQDPPFDPAKAIITSACIHQRTCSYKATLDIDNTLYAASVKTLHYHPIRNHHA